MKTNRLQEIQNRINVLNEVYERKWHDKTERTWEEFQEYVKEELDELSELSREKRMIMPYEMEEIPDYGDVMSLKDFIECVKNGSFIDYDGFGHYAKDNMMSNVAIIPSDVEHKAIRKDFDTLVWFNR